MGVQINLKFSSGKYHLLMLAKNRYLEQKGVSQVIAPEDVSLEAFIHEMALELLGKYAQVKDQVTIPKAPDSLIVKNAEDVKLVE